MSTAARLTVLTEQDAPVFLQPNQYYYTKFRDTRNVVRTQSGPFETVRNVLADRNAHESYALSHVRFRFNNDVFRPQWHCGGTISYPQMLLSYRPMRRDTVHALRQYVAGDHDAFGAALCNSAFPRDLVEDLQEKLSEGPIFEIPATRRIIRDTYASLNYQEDLDPNKVPICIRVIADDILRAFYRPSFWNSYVFQPMSTNLENSENWPNFFQAFEYVICPSAEQNIEQNVYSYAAFFAMVIEGALEAARHINVNNNKHAQKVALGISFSFVVVQAILFGSGYGSAFTTLIIQPRDAILASLGSQYAGDQLITCIEQQERKVCSEAKRGGFVPGLPNPEPVEDPDVLYEITQERRHWGAKFVEFVTLIRRFATENALHCRVR